MSNGNKNYFSKTAVKKRKKVFEKAQFVREYKPETTLGQRFGGDISTFFKSLPMIGKGLGRMFGETAEESGLITGKEGGQRGINIDWKALAPPTSLIPYALNLPLVRETGKAKQIKESISKSEQPDWLKFALIGNEGQPDVWTALLNKLYLDSLVENTGKWLYDPKQRAKEWWENPGLTTIEDIANLIPLAYAGKALGIGGKLSTLARYGKFAKYTPKHAAMSKYLPQHAAVTKIARVSKYGELTAVGRTTEPIVRGIGKAKDVITKAVKPRAVLMNQITKYYENLRETRGGLSRGRMVQLLNKVPDEQLAEVWSNIEGWSQVWRPTKRVVTKLLGKEGPELMSLYKYSKQTYGLHKAVKYIREVLRKETYGLYKGGYFGEQVAAAEKIMNAMYGPLAKEFGMTVDDMAREALKLGIRPRHFMHITDDYAKMVGTAAAARGTRGLKKPKVGPLQERTVMETEWYAKDAKIILPMARYKIAQGKLLDGLFGRVRKLFAKEITKKNPLKPGYREVDKFAFKQLAWTRDPFLSGKVRYQIPEWAYKELINVVNNPGSFEKFVRATWDKGTMVWKMSVLALSPRWLVNNFVGNAVLNTLGAVSSPLAYIKALKIMRQANRLARTKGWPLTRAYKRLGIPKGVLESGFYRGEVGVTLGLRPERGLTMTDIIEGKGLANFKKYTGYSAVKKLADKMYNVNSGIETFFRTAHYLDKVGKGYSVTQAIKSVNEFLFKYSSSTWVEKAVIRRVDPFIAWHKNIVRLAVTYPVKHPLRASLLAIANLLYEDEVDYRFIQDWIRSLMPLPFTMGGDQAYLSTAGLNPFNDIFIDLGMLHPVLKMIVERQTGTQLFKGRNFSSPYPIIQGGVEQKALPSVLRHLAMQFPHARTIESMVRPYALYDTGHPMIDRKTGQYKYPKSRVLELAKLFGISVTPYDVEEMQKRGAETAFRSWTQQQNYNKMRSNIK